MVHAVAILPYADVILTLRFLLYMYNASFYKLSRVVRKPTFCICENKDADQLRCNREADQHLCFFAT